MLLREIAVGPATIGFQNGFQTPGQMAVLRFACWDGAMTSPPVSAIPRARSADSVLSRRTICSSNTMLVSPRRCARSWFVCNSRDCFKDVPFPSARAATHW